MIGKMFKRGGRPEPAPPREPDPRPEPELEIQEPVPAPDLEPVPEHKVYTGMRVGGYVWGRCRCGAVLNNEDEVKAHRERYE